MRIGIDASCWSNRRGFGRFTRCLVTEMVRRYPEEDFVLLIDRPSLDNLDLPEGAQVVPVDVDVAPSAAASANGRRSIRDIARMTSAARRLGCGVMFFPATYTYFPVPGTPTVVTVHDAIAEQLPDLILPSLRDRLAWRAKQWLALRNARLVFTVSEASRRAVTEVLGVPPERIRVIHEAPAERFRPLPQPTVREWVGRLGLGDGRPYLLYVGGISPHKNLRVLVEAFELVAAEHPELHLVLVGDTEADPFLSSINDVRARVARSPVRDRVTFTGYVSDEELVALYCGAVASVLPSLGEGFGLPAAESAACGTPVVASEDPALMELLEEDGLYAPAHDAEGFARLFDRLLMEIGLRSDLSARLLRRAAGWSWAPAADTVVEALRTVENP
jgi:glycosyltransferase involved in cell wall biosynthesis